MTPDLPYEDPETTYAERIAPALAALDGAVGARAAGKTAAASPGAAGEAHAPRVVVVGHSLAAGYAPLVAAATPGASLAYLCPAPVGPFAKSGAPMRSSHEDFEFPPNRPDGTSVWEPETAIAVMYPRLEPDVARGLAARLKPGSSPADSYPLDEHPDVPTTFVYAAHDEFFTRDWSRWVAHEIADAEPVELPTGHFAMLEAPDLVADLLLR
jgi:pimeloyl-ACP methyl ester carboxylesterase